MVEHSLAWAWSSYNGGKQGPCQGCGSSRIIRERERERWEAQFLPGTLLARVDLTLWHYWIKSSTLLGTAGYSSTLQDFPGHSWADWREWCTPGLPLIGTSTGTYWNIDNAPWGRHASLPSPHPLFQQLNLFLTEQLLHLQNLDLPLSSFHPTPTAPLLSIS